MSKKKFYLVLGALLTLVGYVVGHYQKYPVSQNFVLPAQSSLQNSTPSASLEKVTRVIDGDTIEITGEGTSPSGVKVRYIGINAPESVTPGKPIGCFGREASDKNKELVLGKDVRLEKDVSETDKYGRLLRYVFVGDTFVNDTLVRSGYARVSTYQPDVKYQNQFLQAERYARENNLGLWSQCSL